MQSIINLCAVVLVAISSSANAKETIIWALVDWPPYFITQGEFQGQGVGDRFTDYFISRLPGFEHDKKEMTLARVDKEAQLGRTTCMTNRFYTEERAKHSYYTKPYSMSLSLKIILMEDTHRRIRRPSELSVEVVNEGFMLNGALEFGRSYGADLDPLLEQYLSSPLLSERRTTSAQLLDMLQLKRLDYFIEYPLNFTYLTQTRSLDPGKFVNVEISESPAYVLSWVSCSKTELGRKVVEQLNSVIDAEKAKPEYLELVTHWLPEPDAQKLERYYREEILSE